MRENPSTQHPVGRVAVAEFDGGGGGGLREEHVRGGRGEPEINRISETVRLLDIIR